MMHRGQRRPGKPHLQLHRGMWECIGRLREQSIMTIFSAPTAAMAYAVWLDCAL